MKRLTRASYNKFVKQDKACEEGFDLFLEVLPDTTPHSIPFTEANFKWLEENWVLTLVGEFEVWNHMWNSVRRWYPNVDFPFCPSSKEDAAPFIAKMKEALGL